MKKFYTGCFRFALLMSAGSVIFAADPAPVYLLPFPDSDARYFFAHEGTLYLGNHPARTLYRLAEGNTLQQAATLEGWYILDATFFAGRIFYCSRQRVLYEQGEKVITVPVADTESLIALTTDGRQLYLLDERTDARGKEIVILNSDLQRTAAFPCPGRNPLDLCYARESLWIYDQADKCIHRLDLQTKQVTARIHTPVDHSWSKGILFYNNVLYVHDRTRAALIPVLWSQEENAVISCRQQISYTFRLHSRNLSETAVCTAEFRVPIPGDGPGTRFFNLQFTPEPELRQADIFGQQLAYFRDVRIPPQDGHWLTYTAQVVNASVQYTLKEVALRTLAEIPAPIRELYLRSDTYLPLNDPGLRKISRQARLDSFGKQPTGVKALVENLVEYIISHLEYIMDDAWDSAEKVIARGTGSCSEYSFLFSALARLNDVPTRLCGGVQLDGAFHRWTEIWYPGTGWVPVDVTKIDSTEFDSRDYEYLFGNTYLEIPLSRIGTCDDSDLGVNYYIYRYYTGGKRERSVEVIVHDVKALEQGKEIQLTQG